MARKAANRQKNGQVKVEPKAEVKLVAPEESKKVETPKVTEPAPKTVEPAPEAPKKRVRQRIRITSATPVRERIEFFKKK